MTDMASMLFKGPSKMVMGFLGIAGASVYAITQSIYTGICYCIMCVVSVIFTQPNPLMYSVTNLTEIPLFS